MNNNVKPTERTATSISRVIGGGLVATYIVGAALMMKNAIGAFPDVHIPQTLSVALGVPGHLMAGGVALVIIGMFLLSSIYAAIAPRLPLSSNVIKGLVFGFVVWLAMMIIVMPLAGAGIFALHRSAVVPAVELVLTLIYGLTLAVMYASGNPRRREIQ